MILLDAAQRSVFRMTARLTVWGLRRFYPQSTVYRPSDVNFIRGVLRSDECAKVGYWQVGVDRRGHEAGVMVTGHMYAVWCKRSPSGGALIAICYFCA